MYVAQNPIRVFDVIQQHYAKEQAASMRDPAQELNKYIEFGRNWAKVGLAYARQDYEVAKGRRAYAAVRELEEREELEELEEESA